MLMSFIHLSSGLDQIYYPFRTRDGLKGSPKSVFLKPNKRESGGGNEPALGETEKTETTELRVRGRHKGNEENRVRCSSREDDEEQSQGS